MRPTIEQMALQGVLSGSTADEVLAILMNLDKPDLRYLQSSLSTLDDLCADAIQLWNESLES